MSVMPGKPSVIHSPSNNNNNDDTESDSDDQAAIFEGNAVVIAEVMQRCGVPVTAEHLTAHVANECDIPAEDIAETVSEYLSAFTNNGQVRRTGNMYQVNTEHGLYTPPANQNTRGIQLDVASTPRVNNNANKNANDQPSTVPTTSATNRRRTRRRTTVIPRENSTSDIDADNEEVLTDSHPDGGSIMSRPRRTGVTRATRSRGRRIAVTESRSRSRSRSPVTSRRPPAKGTRAQRHRSPAK